MIFSPFTPIPSEYRVILPKSNQTVFDAPSGYFIYQGSTLLVVPSSPLLLSCAKLMVVSPLSTSSEGSSIYVELRLVRYLTSVRVFPDPILFLAGLKPSWEYGQQRPAIMTGGKDDEDLSFLPKEPSLGFGTGSLSVSVNTEPLKDNEELVIQPVEVAADSRESLKPELFVVHSGSVAAWIKDRKCKTRGESSRPLVKRKLAPGVYFHSLSCPVLSLHHGFINICVSSFFLDLLDVLELKDATSCHLKIFAITPLAWKNHLDNYMDVDLLDLHDRCYARQVVVDNAINRRARVEEYEGLRVKCEAVMTEFKKNPAVVALREKISAFSTEFKEHKLNLDRMMLESQKWVGYQQSHSTLESNVTSLEAEKASDDMGSLIGRLVSSAILYERCRAYEQVANMKDPFDLLKVKGYRSSYKKDHTQASNDFAIATFPWFDEFVADPLAPIKVLLSKKPPSLQMHVPSRTQVPFPTSQRATLSSTLLYEERMSTFKVDFGWYPPLGE
ncbi:hypothetical protein Tco_1378095 [Tanacetum coccineum]